MTASLWWYLVPLIFFSSDSWTIDQLEDYMALPLQLPVQYVAEYEIRHQPYTRRGASSPVEQPAQEVVDQVRVAVDGSRVRHEIRPGGADARPLVSVWDGSCQAIIWPRSREVIIVESPVPPDLTDLALLYNQLFGAMTGKHFWIPVTEHGDRYIESVSHSDEGLDITLRGWVREDYVGTTWNMRFSGDSEPRLLALERLIPVVGDSQPVRIERWNVESWTAVDGAMMPDNAVYTVEWRHTDANGEHQWYEQQHVYRRLLLKSADEIDQRTFDLPTEIGTRVADERLDIAYEIGRNTLVYGGTVYELPEPIMEHPGDQFGMLLSQATVIDPTRTISGGKTEVVGWSRLRTALLLAMVVSGIAFIVIRCLRTVRRKAA